MRYALFRVGCIVLAAICFAGVITLQGCGGSSPEDDSQDPSAQNAEVQARMAGTFPNATVMPVQCPASGPVCH